MPNHEKAAKSYMGLQGRSLGLAISVISTTGFLLFGYDQGVMSGIIAADPFNDYFPQTKNNSTYQGFVTAIYEIGCLLGAIFTLTFGDTLGRRKNMIWGGITMIVGVIIQVTAFKGHSATAQFIVGRVITGIGNGMNTSTIPTYQAECSRSANRGLLICIEGGIIAWGTMIAYWLDYGASYAPENIKNFTWRFPIAFQVVFGVVLIVGTIFLPESPRWLLTQDRHEEGLAVLAAIQGLPEDHADVVLQKTVILDSIAQAGAAGGKTPFSALFTGGKTQHFRRMLLGASSQIMQQLGGCNAVIYYFPILFETAIGTSKNLALLLGGINMIVYAISATFSWFFIEKIGRRQLFLIGTIGQLCSMILVFGCLCTGSTQIANGAAVGLFTYIAFFGATWLPLPWLYPAEINPLRTRARANAVSTCANWLMNFTIVMITPIMVSSLGAFGFGTYIFFGAMNACFIPIIYFFYPETKKRSLEEIDLIFAKGYLENISYVKASKELPYLDEEGISRMAREYGFVDADEETKIGEKGDSRSDVGSNGGSEKEDRRRHDSESTDVDGGVLGAGIGGGAVHDQGKHEGFRND